MKNDVWVFFFFYFIRVFIVDGRHVWRDCKRLRSEKKSSSGNVFDVDSLKIVFVWFVVGVVITEVVGIGRRFEDLLVIDNGKSTARWSFIRES